MALKAHPSVEISEALLEAIRSFPVQREIEHCGARITVGPFDFYAECSRCGSRIKVRFYSATPEIEDIFDAVFEWMKQPEALDAARRRQAALEDEG